MKSIFFFPFLFGFLSLQAQVVTETKHWCAIECELTQADKDNVELLYLEAKDDSIRNAMITSEQLRFPLRIGIVQADNSPTDISEVTLRKALDGINRAFEPAGFYFYLQSVDLIVSPLNLEDLSANAFNIYDEFSQTNDKEDIITMYILNHKNDFCETSNGSIRCGRTGGFSYIYSDRTNNVVISKFDLLDEKIVAHEFGHFFGLYHTFEEGRFGKDDFDADKCLLTGDRICDTPPDPGAAFEVHVNYSICEMIGWKDENGNEFKPLITNYMSYYKPCYLKKYDFTEGQIEVVRLAGHTPLRKRFSR